MTLVKINIKTPCQEFEDREFECKEDWSVRNLKLEIEKHWLNHPRPDDQRLVYAGKLLQDEWILSDILRQDEELNCHTMHLIFRQTSFASSSKGITAATSELRQRKNQNTSQSASATELYQNIMSSATPGNSTSNTNAASNIPSGTNISNLASEQFNPWQMYLNSQSVLTNQNSQYMGQTPEQVNT